MKLFSSRKEWIDIFKFPNERKFQPQFQLPSESLIYMEGKDKNILRQRNMNKMDPALKPKKIFLPMTVFHKKKLIRNILKQKKEVQHSH